MSAIIYQLANVLRKLGVQFHEEDDPRVRAMQSAIGHLGSIQFKIEVLSDGSWVAESTNISGILTGGTRKESMNDFLKDAVFTYFEIPPHLCNDRLIKTQSEPMELQQRVYA